MPSILELKTRIRSIGATKKITKAQELIATSRITKAQSRVNASLPYERELSRSLRKLASSTSLDHILLTKRENARRSGIIVVTSDRGMCGAYNHNVLKEAMALKKMLIKSGKEPVFFILGAKGLSYFQYSEEKIAGGWKGFSQEPHTHNVAQLTKFLQDLIVAGSDNKISALSFDNLDESLTDKDLEISGIDELHIVYTHFKSMMIQKAQATLLAPMDINVNEIELQNVDGLTGEEDEPKYIDAEYEFEPDPHSLLDMVLPKYINFKIFSSLLDAATSESASRRTAMKAATDNAEELEKTLKRKANLARQAQITSEISEIVGTSAALGG